MSCPSDIILTTRHVVIMINMVASWIPGIHWSFNRDCGIISSVLIPMASGVLNWQGFTITAYIAANLIAYSTRVVTSRSCPFNAKIFYRIIQVREGIILVPYSCMPDFEYQSANFSVSIE